MTAAERGAARRILRRHFLREPLFLFGSRATGTGWRYSDCDVYVEASAEEDPAVARRRVAAAREELSESDLPFEVDVFHPALLSAAFRDFIRRDFQPL